MSDHTAALRASRTFQRMEGELDARPVPSPPVPSPPLSARPAMTPQEPVPPPSPAEPAKPAKPPKAKPADDPAECVRRLLDLAPAKVSAHLGLQDRLELRKLTTTSDLEGRILLNPVEFVATCTVVGALLGVLLGTLFGLPPTPSPPPLALRGAAGAAPPSAQSSRRLVRRGLSSLA